MTTDTYNNNDKTTLGFWIYIMTDCVIFASLFATFLVLRNNTANGPGGHDIFNLSFVLLETLLLLTSSFTSGIALIAMRQKQTKQLFGWLGATFALGAGFLALELYEFSQLVSEGHSWQQSGFLTGFFTLVGTHGLHIAIGLLWLGIMMLVIRRKGLTPGNERKITLFNLFWHFLDIVWILIFTIVYLIGVAIE